MPHKNIKAILIHGNGGGNAHDGWIPDVAKALTKLGVKVTNETFPDPVLARAEVWLPHIEALGADEHTILIGHSSGAVAALRYAERHKLLGSVLVSASYTDLGEETERLSGYFDKAWDWPAIKRNQQWTIIFHSDSDPWIPVEEPRFIAEQLGSEYHELPGRGHFLESSFPELVSVVRSKL